MKFTPLIYVLIFSMLLPPPHVFAAGDAAPAKTYVQRLNDVIKAAADREKEIIPLKSAGPSCGPSSWVNNCNGTTAGGEIGGVGDKFKGIRTSLEKLQPEAVKLDAAISTDKVEATTACKGGTNSIAEYQAEKKKAAEKIRPVLAEALNQVRAMRTKYNARSAGFIPMVRQCGGAKMYFASDSDLPQFAGEGFVMLYKPISGTSESCDPAAADAAKFFVDANMRVSANPGVHRIYGMAKDRPSSLQQFEAVASATLTALDGRIKDLGEAITANKSRDKSDCGPVAAAPKVEPAAKPKEAVKSGVSGDEKKPETTAKVTGSKPENDADAAAKAAEAKGKLDPSKKELPVVSNNKTKSAGSAADGLLGVKDEDIVWDEGTIKAPKKDEWTKTKAEDPDKAFGGTFKTAEAPAKSEAPAKAATRDLTVTKDDVVDVSMPEDSPTKTRNTPRDMQDEIAIGRGNFEKEQAAKKAEATPIETTGPATAPETAPVAAGTTPKPESNPNPETKPERQPPAEGPAVAQKEPPAKEQTTVLTQEQTGAKPPPTPTPVAETSPNSSSMLGIGLLGLAAAGGAAAYFITKKNRKTSSLPPLPPAPAPSATATATDTATATATSTATATNTGIGTSTATGTSTGTSTGTETITLTQTNASSSETVTATSSSTNTATRESANVTGSSLFRPSATP